MCFVNDYQWRAGLVDDDSAPAASETKCDECYRTIAVGQMAHTIHMEEADDGCIACDRGDCACVGDCCECTEPSPGETFDYTRCDDCDRFLDAVQHAEEAAGCDGDEARPALTDMREAIHNGGRDVAKRYFKTAAREFPELVKSGFLGWLWRWMF